MSRSNYTGRCARSLVEAFGPYTSQNIEDDGYSPWSLPSLAIAAIGVLFAALVVIGLIP